jgi:hypothetical protein
MGRRNQTREGSMSKFRAGPDAPERRAPKQPKPGTLPLSRIAVLDHKGNMRGHVGKLATSLTASRFLGGKPAYLDKDDKGKPCWRGIAARP